MEVKVIPAVAVLTGLTVLILGLSSGKSKKSQNYQDAVQGADGFDGKLIAETLFDAMKETDFTNDAKKITIFSALEGVSQEQFRSVVLAFGSRNYNTYFGNQRLAPNKYPLKIWLKEELSTSDYTSLKTFYPKYL